MVDQLNAFAGESSTCRRTGTGSCGLAPSLPRALGGTWSDFPRERVQLVHHRIDRVFQFENFALHVDCDLA